MKEEDVEYWEEELQEEAGRLVRPRPRLSVEEKSPSRKRDSKINRLDKNSFWKS